MSAPRTLGRYELVEKLAVGGMAEIYIARAKSVHGFEKEYVLKLIHPKHGDDEDFMRMLVDEAKLTAQLTHVNIAQVIDLGIHDDTYYIVMEYIRGRDLYQILNQAYDRNLPVPIGVCAFIAKELAEGLHYAHTKTDNESGNPLNLVHRDISPQNVLVSWDGEVKIIDFGVAKAALSARPETQAGVIKGKFRYMSPEQAWGEKLDGRSDLFSAGLCLYEMATSSMAYDDDPDMRRMLIKMREANFVPPASVRPDINPEFEAIMMMSLKRRRHQRYGSAEEFEVALSRYLARHEPEFTRGSVRDFLAKLYPDEGPYIAPQLVEPDSQRQPATEPLESGDVLSTMDLSSRRLQHLAPPPEIDEEEEIDTGDLTAKTVLPDDSMSMDFADEKTELYTSDDDLESAGMTRQMAPNISGGLREASGFQQRTTHKRQPPVQRPIPIEPRSPAVPVRSPTPGFSPIKPPTSVPTAWIPKEFIGEGANPAPSARSVFSEIMQDPAKRSAVLPFVVVILAMMIFVVFLAIIL